MALNPLQIIFKHPLTRLASPLAIGAVCTIVDAWMEADCPSLGDNPDYMGIAGLRPQDWNNHKKVVIEILHGKKGVMPKLFIYQERKLKVLEQKRQCAAKGRAAMLEQRLSKRAKEMLSDRMDSHVEIVAVPPPHIIYNDGKFDPEARKSAVRANKKKSDKLLTDK